MSDPKEYDPEAVKLAYELAMQSYGLAERRFEAMNGRIQGLIVLAIALVLAIPIVVEMFNVTPSRCLGIPMTISLGIIGIGIWARFGGIISFVDPKSLDEKLPGLSEQALRVSMIAKADSDRRKTDEAIEKKFHLAIIMSILLAAMVLSTYLSLLLSL